MNVKIDLCRLCQKPTAWEVCPSCETGLEAKERGKKERLMGLKNYLHAEDYDLYCNMPDWLLAESVLAFMEALRKQTIVKGDR